MTASSDEIVTQLKQFGYTTDEITSSINATNNKTDINQIVEHIEKTQQNKQNAILKTQMNTELYDNDKIEEIKKQWNETKDQIDEEFEEDEKASDLSISRYIRCVKTIPETENKSTIKNTYIYWNPETDDIAQDIYLIFDMNDTKIDSFDITFDEEYYASTIKIYCCENNSNNIYAWDLIKIKRNIQQNESIKFYLKSKHFRYIKIGISDRATNAIEVNYFKWYGFEPHLLNEITDKIRIYQCSDTKYGYDGHKVLLKNTETWASNGGEHSFIIFDCGQYEIESIYIKFEEKSKPEIVKLGLSDVGCQYSFRGAVIQKWKLKTTQSWGDDYWNDVELDEELKLSKDIYKNGFKRFLQLRFGKYQNDNMQIVNVRFYGKLSDRIPDDDEQFDSALHGIHYNDIHNDVKQNNDDEKKEPDAQYRPEVVDSSPSAPNSSTSNIWKQDEYVYWTADEQFDPYLVIDLGNNEVDEIVVVVYPYYPCKVCKISTSDKIKSKDSDWVLLYNDNEMESKMENGGRYNISKRHKSYLKFEFSDMKNKIFALSQLYIFGDSQFLHKEDKVINITIDDIKNMTYIDEDLVSKYKNQQMKQTNKELVKMHEKLKAIENDKAKGKFSTEWNNLRIEELNKQLSTYYTDIELDAYQSPTIFNQQELMQLAELVKGTVNKYSNEIVLIETESGKKIKEMEEYIFSKKQEFAESKDKKQVVKAFQEKGKEKHAMSIQYSSKKQALYDELDVKIEGMKYGMKCEDIYSAWKEAIEQHPRQISSKYNVGEYDMMLKWAQINKPKEFKQLLARLADLFDESFETRKELLHKFLVFQLSVLYDKARSKSYGRPPIFILFDCGKYKLNRIEFKVTNQSGCYFNKIDIYSANELVESKMDDDDEKDIIWNNFKKIAQKEFDDTMRQNKSKGISFEQSKIDINYNNDRYVKVVFTDFDENQTECSINQMRFFMKSNDKNELDDEQMAGGNQLEKYKLKLIADSNFNPRSIKNIRFAYDISSGGYRTDHGVKKPYLIFDCETRKIDKFEIEFSEGKNNFKTMDVLTSDNNETDAKWSKLFSFAENEQYEKIQIDRNNKRYLKILFEMNWHILEIEHLKFYTTDSSEYKWDIDNNIKNLTRNVKVIKASKHTRDCSPENLFREFYDYTSKSYGSNHKQQILNRIRDEVCKGVNLLRTSNGSKISKHTKHFLKFLLCFQNELHYKEMLYSSQLIMNILRKPLDIEYKRLQNINSKILLLRLDKKHKCKNIN
eukprot:540372_1